MLDTRSQTIAQEINEARKLGNAMPVRYDVMAIAKDGSKKNIELSTVLVDVSGEHLVMGIMRDVTSRRNMEHEITFRSRFLKLLMNLSLKFINIPSSKVDEEIDCTGGDRKVYRCG
ncbi:MAG: PAS domain S-box protein [Bacteroidales bacterium]|nr:PAS domain S-box protein [Bacteroidales bacterium]MDD4384530.1 PAS domain S-box protein [Bacteroidales bacterium]MDY0197461.1 PAS domain S-box protein [Tenuifilaceae bacterium]